MASLRTPASSQYVQGIATVVNISSCVTGDTVSYLEPVKAWITVNKTTTDAISTTYSASTGLFTITVANTPDVAIIILG